MNKHTLGPWYRQYDDNGFYKIGSEAAGLNIAFTFGESDTDEANACLIAAAPDLLEALESMLQSFLITQSLDDYPIDAPCNKARAAIRKAKGEV